MFDTSDQVELCEVVAPDPAALAARKHRLSAARSARIRQRIRLARAAGEEALAALLPERIERDDSWHVISAGNVDGLSYTSHLLKAGPVDHLIVSTWCMALDDVQQLAAWIADGCIGRLDCYVGEIFPSQYANTFDALCAAVRANPRGGRVAVFRNHSKVQVLARHALGDYLVVESSANLNTNPRAEQTAITASAELARFYERYFAGVRSIVRNFDDWQDDHGWPTA